MVEPEELQEGRVPVELVGLRPSRAVLVDRPPAPRMVVLEVQLPLLVVLVALEVEQQLPVPVRIPP